MQSLSPVIKNTLSPHQCAGIVLDALPDVMWYVRKQMRSRRAKGLSVPQFRTLVTLDRYPSAPLSSVAERLAASLPTVSRMVSGLVSQGLILRKSSTADRRQVSLALTARGKAVLQAAWGGTQ